MSEERVESAAAICVGGVFANLTTQTLVTAGQVVVVADLMWCVTVWAQVLQTGNQCDRSKACDARL